MTAAGTRSFDESRGFRDARVEAEPLPRLELVCSACLYGVVVSHPPPRCPMCGGSDWQEPLHAGILHAAETLPRPTLLEGVDA